MKKLNLPLVLLNIALAISLICPQSLYAYWVWSPEAGKFVNAEGVAEGPAEEQFKYALTFIDEGKPEKAIDELEGLVKRYPSAKIAADALFQAGVLYEKKSDHYKAFQTYKKILEAYPQSPRIDEVVERTYAIGNLFLSGQKARLMGVAIVPAMPKAIEVFSTISASAPFSAYGDRATFNLGVAYKKNHNYAKAIEAFQKLIDDYPQSELLSDAKYQMADTAFQMSVRKSDRDLSSLDTAEQSAEKFIEENPESHMTPRAQELVKTIIEKNAEKNYKIGLYYEKENYIDSALIYYQDVVRKYPQTSWAAQARERLARIKEPQKFMQGREEEILGRIKSLDEKQRVLDVEIAKYEASGDKIALEVAEKEKKRIETERKGLDKELKGLSKFKRESVHVRLKMIRIKQKELKEKWKNLKAKKKYYKKRMSDDLVKAFQRWEESLRAEEYALERERLEVEQLGASWGVRTEPLIALPFLHRKGERAALFYKDKDLEKMRAEIEKLALDVQVLKEEHATVIESLGGLGDELSSLYLGKEGLGLEAEKAGGAIALRQAELRRQKETLDALARQLKVEYGTDVYARSGISFAGVMAPIAKTLAVPVQAAGKSVSWVGSALPKFGSDKKAEPIEKLQKNEEELRARVAYLKDQINLTQSAIKSLKDEEAADTTAAAAKPEVSEPAKTAQTPASSAPEPKEFTRAERREIQKELRRLRREVRTKYQDVEDRKRHKDKLIDELAREVEEVKKSVGIVEMGKTALKPVAGMGWLARSFVFGLPDKEKEAVKSAQKLEKGLSAEQITKVSDLKDEIEYETIMIDTRRSEILVLEKKLNDTINFAKTAGLKVRDESVARPDYILKENFEKVGRLIAPNTREEILSSRLDRFSRELDEVLIELDSVERAIQDKEDKTKREAPAAEAPTTPEPGPAPAAPAVESAQPVLEPVVPAAPPTAEADLKARFFDTKKKYEEAKVSFEREFKKYLSEKGAKKSLEAWESEEERIADKRTDLMKKRNKIEKELSGLYHEEAAKIESMRSLVDAKIVRIDEALKTSRFKAAEPAEELRKERKSLESLLADLGVEIKNLRDEETKILEPLEAKTYV